jgi:hypothetical protein
MRLGAVAYSYSLMRFSGVLAGLSVYQATASDDRTRSRIVHSTAHIQELPQEE